MQKKAEEAGLESVEDFIGNVLEVCKRDSSLFEVLARVTAGNERIHKALGAEQARGDGDEHALAELEASLEANIETLKNNIELLSSRI